MSQSHREINFYLSLWKAPTPLVDFENTNVFQATLDSKYVPENSKITSKGKKCKKNFSRNSSSRA